MLMSHVLVAAPCIRMINSGASLKTRSCVRCRWGCYSMRPHRFQRKPVQWVRWLCTSENLDSMFFHTTRTELGPESGRAEVGWAPPRSPGNAVFLPRHSLSWFVATIHQMAQATDRDPAVLGDDLCFQSERLRVIPASWQQEVRKELDC